LKPVLDTVVTSGAVHFYISQSDKGELVMGGDIDGLQFVRPAQQPARDRAFGSIEIALFPSFSRVRMMRTWGGVMDMSMDGSPIIGKSPVANLYLDCGWCYGGFKPPRIGLVLRAHDRQRRAARTQCRLHA